MASLTRKIRRDMERSGKLKKRRNRLDAYNDHLFAIGKETSVMTHVRHLHPTKGYRRESKLAMAVRATEPRNRWAVFILPMIRRAQAHARKVG